MLQVREYKADLAKLQESAKAAGSAASGGAAARAELGLVDDYSQTSAGQRERLLQTTDKMGRTGERITQGRQQLLETEVSTTLPVLPQAKGLEPASSPPGILHEVQSHLQQRCLGMLADMQGRTSRILWPYQSLDIAL